MVNNEMNEEYKLQEGEEQHSENYNEYQTEPNNPENVPSPVPAKNTRIKRLLIPVGIIIAIFIVYNILNWFSAKRSQSEINPQTESALAQKQQTSVNTAPAGQAAPPVALQQSPISQPSVSQADIDAINKNNEAIKDQLTDLNQKLAANQSELVSLSSKMDQLAGAVITIQDELEKAKNEAEKLKKAKAVKPKKVIIPIYHVRAIVPNRAWLESSEGETKSVRVGDKLYGYGTVELISPKQGMVVMSSGTIIQYGENDF